ncbi:Uncharacterized protein YktA, UPF0223 family [Amphibacillus marinus]|uniref:Uncharacterized protein YktA, UPF0223 family n=1 Tax=Amphibacillus marinus TaxID=872970 RepID=A0A1H8I8Y3_9BACI|nr:UPF0223 family protein [Amphibacillus marinus]SEN64647.1 Uncharacterized protein YktA, UPF0223 family [Amphibacillus marinus]
MNYNFPLDESWSTNEIVSVVEFLSIIEQAYHKAISAQEIISKYRRFKEIVPSKGEEKAIGRQFEKETGCSLYLTVKQAQQNSNQKIIMSKYS